MCLPLTKIAWSVCTSLSPWSSLNRSYLKCHHAAFEKMIKCLLLATRLSVQSHTVDWWSYWFSMVLALRLVYIYCSGWSNVTRQTISWTHVSIMLVCISVVLISTMIYSSYLSCLGEACSLCLSRTSEENLKTVERKFPSGYFNNVYSCLRFLFPVLLSMLPALPFLLFLHHYCPLLAKKRHCALWSQHPVCQQLPKNLLTGVKHTSNWSGKH